MISTHTAGADVSQITVNGAFLSSKPLTHRDTQRHTVGLPLQLLCVFIGLQEAKMPVSHR